MKKSKMEMRFKYAISVVIIFGLFSGCSLLRETPPTREFSTPDLLLYPDLLPNGWEITAKPTTQERLDAMGLRNTIRGSQIVLQTSNSSIDQMVVVFPSKWDATRSYKDHDYTGNTYGLYPTTWEPMFGFEYTSPLADQFRVVCSNIANVKKIGEECIIEAQYDEFFSILIYHTKNADQAIDELGLIAKTVDSQMLKYLEKQPETNP